MRRSIPVMILSASTILAGVMALVPGMVAGASGDGLCRLLTTKEVRQALGPGKWQIADDGDAADQCYMHNGRLDKKSRAFSMRLLRSNEENQQEWRDDALASGAQEHLVAGLPAVQDGHAAVTIFLPDPWDMLQLSPVGFEKDDVSVANLGLAELAAGRYAAELGLAVAPSPGASPSGGAAALPACELLTDDEVDGVMVDEAMSRQDASDTRTCAWMGDQGSLVFINVDTTAPGTTAALLDAWRSSTPGAVDTQVAGLPASQSTDATGATSTLFMVPEDGVGITLGIAGQGTQDVAARTLALGVLAAGRWAASAVPVAGSPGPSAAAAASGAP